MCHPNVSYAHYQIPMKKTDQNHIKIMQLTFEIMYGLQSLVALSLSYSNSTFYVKLLHFR